MEHIIALTSANEPALETVTPWLLDAAAKKRLRIQVLQGVKVAAEATSIYSQGGELWRIGEDASKPELDALVDRAIDDSSRLRMAADCATAFDSFLSKARVA
jgi:hypothetical protein